MKLIVGFLFLGFLIGDMAGHTAESVVSKLIALLFALFGGSVVVLFQKLEPDARSQIGMLLASISVGALLGIHAGILTTQYRLLSPHAVERPAAAQATPPQQTAPPQLQTLPQGGALKALEPPKGNENEAKCPPPNDPYLRRNVQEMATAIDERLDQKLISTDEAYRELRELIQKGGRK